jgi:hypothetical protein
MKLPLLKSSKKMVEKAFIQALMLKATKGTAGPLERLSIVRTGTPLKSWLPGTEHCSTG